MAELTADELRSIKAGRIDGPIFRKLIDAAERLAEVEGKLQRVMEECESIKATSTGGAALVARLVLDIISGDDEKKLRFALQLAAALGEQP